MTQPSGAYADIADHAVLGDGRTVALVTTEGNVDWWPFPTLDAPPVCAAILDPERGGNFRLVPDVAFVAKRRYIEGTNVLETTYTTEAGEARVTVALNTGSAGRLPWTELAHRVEGVRGNVPMRWEFVAGDRFGTTNPWVTQRNGVFICSVADQALGLIVDGLDRPTLQDRRIEGRFRTEPGRRQLLAVVGSDAEPLFLPRPDAIEGRLDRTIDAWRRWSGQLDTHGPWAAAMERSALALKTLIAEYTGAIAAAATTSLPESIGGSKNWDYRYAWVRDSSFTLDALINLGLHEEVHGAVSWLLHALRRNGPDPHVFYTLGGEVPSDAATLDVPGYRHSQPVRAGNAATTQTQLGIYGDLFDTISRYTNEGHLLDLATGQMLGELADQCCDRWQDRDSGMWELDALEHYTISKMGCWVALDRAAQLASTGQIPNAHAERWVEEADRIRRWVRSNCWSSAKRAYTFYAGTEDLDAAVLLAGRTNFDRGEGLIRTIEAVGEELGRGPFLYRYSGMDEEEGAFVACSFWMVEALVHTGQLSRAKHTMADVVALANDVGLLAEQIDPTSGDFLGNFPQGLSHLALVNAAATLRKASGS